MILFFATMLLAGGLLARVVPFSDFGVLPEVAREIGRGFDDRVSDRRFAFALAPHVVRVTGALAIAYLLVHVVLIRLALKATRRDLGRMGEMREFAEGFDALRERLERNALIGHASSPRRSSWSPGWCASPWARSPSSTSALRARLFGLKMMGAVPSYFVSLGPLLTYIGFVIVLNRMLAVSGGVGGSPDAAAAGDGRDRGVIARSGSSASWATNCATTASARRLIRHDAASVLSGTGLAIAGWRIKEPQRRQRAPHRLGHVRRR